MIKLTRLLIAIMVFFVIAQGCEPMLESDSDRIVFADDNKPNTPNEALYSLAGIYSQLDKLAARYVLLGELRGDLMDITTYSNPYLREISGFNISKDNPYNNLKDYYTVINNCNYLVKNMDTSIVMGAEKIMYTAFAAAKAVRAWTYMQIALNYGTVKYYEDPILTVKDSGNFIEYSLQELLPVLINDLEPYKQIEKPPVVSIGVDLSSDKLHFPVRFVLGDLYLWNREYGKAATEYYDLMNEYSYIIDESSLSKWTVDNGTFLERALLDQKWLGLFELNSQEQTTLIAGSTEYGQGNVLRNLSLSNQITPSNVAILNWDNQYYYDYNNSKFFYPGDLRGDYGSYLSGSYTYENVSYDYNIILKYYLMADEISKAVTVYRTGLLYLRYAEAVNRAGKPNLAFAVLKHGMNSETMAEDTIVPRREKFITYTDTTGTFFNYANFEDTKFDENIGVHERGCGNISKANDYRIAAQGSIDDSILYVEDKIIEELALETAFEGNRFHDLMRIALRRDDPSYLANKVSEKYTSGKDVIRSKLLDQNNWYLKP